MNFLGVGLPEMILIFVVALLVFGPRKLPEISRTIARTVKSLQDASKEFETAINREANELEKTTRAATNRPSRLNPKANRPQTSPEGTSSASASVESTSAETIPPDLDSPEPNSSEIAAADPASGSQLSDLDHRSQSADPDPAKAEHTQAEHEGIPEPSTMNPSESTQVDAA